MNLKNAVLTLSLLAATAVATSGCGRGVNVIDFAGQDLSSPSDAVSPDAISPTEPTGSDIIVPENTGTTTTDSGTTTDTGTTPPDTGSGASNEPYCPAGTASQGGNGTLCCRIDDPQICFIVDPVPPGGVKPGVLADHLLDAVISTDPTPPPPDSGDTGGTGGLNDTQTPNCYHKDPYGGNGGSGQGRRMNQDTHPGAGEVTNVRGCIMI